MFVLTIHSLFVTCGDRKNSVIVRRPIEEGTGVGCKHLHSSPTFSISLSLAFPLFGVHLVFILQVLQSCDSSLCTPVLFMLFVLHLSP